MIGRLKGHREIRQIVQDQIEEWEKQRGHAVQHAHLAGNKKLKIDYITISREIGSGGEEIGAILAEQLHWQLYDKEILDYMAEDMKVHKSVLESVDEKSGSWIDSLLGPLLPSRTVDHQSYYRHLVKVLLVLASHGQAIIIGRTASYVLPRERGLSVRITAPYDVRSRRYAEENKISLSEAKQIVEKADKEQHSFVKNMLGHDIHDPGHYDIICNTHKFTPTSAAKLIWRTFDQRKTS